MTNTAKIRAAIRKAARRAARAEGMWRTAVEERDALLVAAHGRPPDGMTYDELADAADLSRGRVIQIVQPHRRKAREAS